MIIKQPRIVGFGTSLVAGLGLMAAACTKSETPAPEAASEVKPAETASAPTGECHGVNACKGKGACGGKGTSCAGTNACKGKGWITLTEADCKAKKGKFKAEGAAHSTPPVKIKKKGVRG